jgi:hypothetical protein
MQAREEQINGSKTEQGSCAGALAEFIALAAKRVGDVIVAQQELANEVARIPAFPGPLVGPELTFLSILRAKIVGQAR